MPHTEGPFFRTIDLSLARAALAHERILAPLRAPAKRIETAVRLAVPRIALPHGATAIADAVRSSMEPAAEAIRALTEVPKRPGPGWAAAALYSSRAFDEETRHAAAECLAKWFPKPIHPKRWSVIARDFGADLEALARAHGRTPTEELHQHVLAALFEAVRGIEDSEIHSGIGDLDLWAWDAVKRKRIAGALNKIVTESVLGPGWRHLRQSVLGPGGIRLPRHVLLEDVHPEELLAILRDPRDHAYAVSLLSQLERRSPALTPSEREAIDCVARGETPTETARRLDVTPEAVRKRLYLARKKISESR